MKNEEGGNSVTTVLLRGTTYSILDDIERAVDDGVNNYKEILTCFSLCIDLYLEATLGIFNCLLQSS